MSFSVRRVRVQEWHEIRGLRLQAVADAAAPIAFLTTTAQELARDDAFWRERAAGAALGETAAQFVAMSDDDEQWVGTATVLLKDFGSAGYGDVDEPRADIVGVYLAPAHRGAGILNLLLDAARAWAGERGVAALTLSVHVDNLRAQAAYRRAGFVPTGVTFTSVIGPEMEMREHAAR